MIKKGLFHIQVTEEHIKKGVAGDSSCCPMALAVREFMAKNMSGKLPWISIPGNWDGLIATDGDVTIWTVREYTGADGKFRMHSKKRPGWSCRVAKFAYDFDRDKPVEPFTLYVRVMV